MVDVESGKILLEKQYLYTEKKIHKLKKTDKIFKDTWDKGLWLETDINR